MRENKSAKLRLRQIDWKKQDIVIAREMGLSRERIRQMRRKARAPRPANYKCHTATLEKMKLISSPEVKVLSRWKAERKLGFRIRGVLLEAFLRTK